MNTYVIAHFSLMNGELKQTLGQYESAYDAMIQYLKLDYNDYPTAEDINEYLGNVEEWLAVTEI